MNVGLNLICTSDLDPATDLQDAWTDPAPDEPIYQSALQRELTSKLDQLRESSTLGSHLDWVPAGGEGLTQIRLLSFLRRESFVRRIRFVLVDMTDGQDFWTTVLQGFLHSLQQNQADGTTQCKTLLEDLLGLPGPLESLQDVMASLRTAEPTKLAKLTAMFTSTLARYSATATTCHTDVIRALIALNSDDQATASVGMTWLRGQTIEESDRQTLGFAQTRSSAREIVEGISWWMSLVAPTVLVFDQLDPVDTPLQLAVNVSDELTTGPAARDEMVAAKSIIEEIGCELTSLRHATRRTLTLVSCRETTWEILLHRMKRISSRCPMVT